MGNLDISATSGQIAKSDGNALTASGQDINLSFATTLDASISLVPGASLSVTKTVGDLIIDPLSAPSLHFSAPGGNVVFPAGSAFASGPVTVSGAGSAVFDSGTVGFTTSLTSTIPLSLGGATVTFGAGVSAPALNLSAGSATFTQNPGLPNLSLSGGTVTINGAATQVIAGGTWDVGAGGVLNLPASGTSIAAGGTLNVHGGAVNYGATLSVAGALELASGTLVGSGVIDVTGSVTKTGAGSFALNNTLNNQGTVTALGGSLVLAGGGTHTGTFSAAAGATLDFNAGTHDFADGSVFSGPGTFDGGGSLNLTGNATGLRLAADTTTDLNALAFAGSGNLTNMGTTSGNGLLLPGDFINAAGATAALTNVTIGGSLYNSGAFNTAGTVTVAGLLGQQLGGVMNIAAGATLDMSNPAAVFSWQDGTIAGTGTLGFSGGGTFLFAGTGDRVIDGLNFAFNNLVLPNGSLTLQSGSLTLTGATVLPLGVALNLLGGTLTNNGTLDVAGSFGLTGGAFTGVGSLNMAGGNLSLPVGNSVNWTNSGTLTNTGTLNLAGATITNSISNLGTINLGGNLTFSQAVTNAGTLATLSGNALFAGGLVQSSGGNIVLNGGSLQGNVNLNAGTIKGSGTVNGNVVVGTATLAPGFSPGSITINGNLNLAPSSVLNIELGGLVRGTTYDWVNVTGTANLAGRLNVTTIGGFVPSAGSTFTVMNFAAKTGAFSTVNLPAGSLFNSLATALSVAVPVPPPPPRPP